MDSDAKREGRSPRSPDSHLFQLLWKCTVECAVQEPLLFKKYSLDVSRMFQSVSEALIKRGKNNNTVVIIGE